MMMTSTNTPEKVSLKPFTLTPTDGKVKESPGKNGVAFDVLIKPPSKLVKVINKRKSDTTLLNEKVLEEKLKSAEARRLNIQGNIQEKQRETITKTDITKETREEKLRMQRAERIAKLERKMALAEQELAKKRKEMDERKLQREERLRRVNKIREELQENKAELAEMQASLAEVQTQTE